MMQTTEDLPKTVRMTLTSDNFIGEYEGDNGTGRHPAGRVLLVDVKTADRWRNKGIAVDSAETDKTLREAKLAELARLQAEIDAIGHEDGAPITRPGGVSSEREVQRGRRTG